MRIKADKNTYLCYKLIASVGGALSVDVSALAVHALDIVGVNLQSLTQIAVTILNCYMYVNLALNVNDN